MDNPAPSLREQGIQALRSGNIDPAVDLLARAVMADSQDAEAQGFLGVAYSQKGMHAQAKRALESAIELQPRNAGFRFNLGVALEQAGDRQGAASAYGDALQINPEHAHARARGQALAAQTAAAPITARRTAVPPSAPSLSNAPWLRGRESPSAVPAGPSGTVQCPNCHQYSKPGMSCEWCSSPLKGAPMAASHAAGGYLESVRGSRFDVEDEFDLAQSFRDWAGVLVSPGRFFREQVGREGLKAPLAFLLLYILFTSLLGMVWVMLRPIPGLPPMFGGIGLIVGLVISSVVGWLVIMVVMFVWAGMVHGICKLFGGQGSYAGTFRATVYALAPLFLLYPIFMLLSAASGPTRVPGLGLRGPAIVAPGSEPPRLRFARASNQDALPGSAVGRRMYRPRASQGYRGTPAGPAGGSPLGSIPALILLAQLVGGIVYLVPMGIGVCHIHGLRTGAAAGVAVISGVLVLVLVVIFFVTLGVLFAAILVGSRGVPH